ncbi:MAG: primosomal protein N', partial [Spartobacteria bacterium]|nr:primosomal protein N' [Spartobacteria bacterium]
KYTLVTLPERADNRRMPLMHVVDMRNEAEKEGGGHIFSRDLIEAIRARLDRGEQTILFLNRRGFSTSLICEKCGYVAQCAECSIAMTYHKSADVLRCHICGASKKVPNVCPAPDCGFPGFKHRGAGTQRIEEIVGKLFPRARVQRMDSDTTTRKESYGRYLGDFRAGKIDILIGTQMIAKGLHFPNVTLVGIIFADMSLHMPDFRAGERTFQLLTQVAGRAGRGDVCGEVIVQTYTPFHAAIQHARRIDFEGFVDQELAFRKELEYPPFSHLVCITLRGKDEEKLKKTGASFAQHLRGRISKEVRMAGPAPAPLARAKGAYRYQIMMRAKKTTAMTRPIKEVMSAFKWPRDIYCAVDVDATSLM